MTTTTATRFEMGRVIGNTFEVLGKNFGPFLLVALVLSGIPAFVLQMISVPHAGFNASASVLNGVFGLIRGVLAFVLQGALVTGAISSLNGNRIDLKAMLSRGASAALPLFGLAILEGLGVALGIVLLLIPGLILATVWSVAVPALVVERTGVFGAFNRSGDLTRGHRWAVFGLMVVYAILSWIVMGVSGAIALGVAGGFGALANGGSSIPFAVFEGVIATLLGALSGAGVAALYYELRLIKEGVAPQAVLDTFS